MRLQTLAYLVDVAKTGSINATACRLFVSQQNVSRAIITLERELGCPLLERSYNGVSLTAEGTVVVEKAQVILNLMDSIREEIHALNQCPTNNLSGHLRVVTNHNANHTIMAGVATRFARTHPRIRLSLSAATMPEVPKILNDREADVALVGYSKHAIVESSVYDEDMKNLTHRRLCEDTLMICISRQLNLGQRSYLRPSDICDLPQISLGEMPLVNDVVFRNTRQPFSLIETSSKDQFKQTIAAGLGFGFSSMLDLKFNFNKEEQKQLAILPLMDEKNNLTYEVLCLPCKNTDPLVTAFMDIANLFVTDIS